MISKLKSLKDHQGFMKYFKNTSWLFSYAQSFVGLFTAIATLGLDGIVVRELVKDESRRETQYSC